MTQKQDIKKIKGKRKKKEKKKEGQISYWRLQLKTALYGSIQESRTEDARKGREEVEKRGDATLHFLPST